MENHHKEKEEKTDDKKKKRNLDCKPGNENELDLLFNDEVQEAREKIIEFADRNRRQLKAEQKARFLFNHAEKDDELGQLLQRAKICQPTFEQIKEEIEAKQPIQTVVGELPMFRPIEEFMEMGLVYLFAGKRRTGKSYLVTELLYKLARKTKVVYVMSTTAFSGYWAQYVDKKFIFEGYRKDIIAQIIEKQRESIENMRKMNPKMSIEDIRSHPDIAKTFVLDDIIADKYQVRADKFLAELAVAGRHYGLTIFITTQYVNSISADFKGNVDVVFIFTQHQRLQKKAIKENFLDFLDEPVADKLLEQVCIEKHETDDFYDPKYYKGEMVVRALVILNFLNMDNKLNTLSWYAAEDYPDFKLGLHANTFNSNAVTEDSANEDILEQTIGNMLSRAQTDNIEQGRNLDSLLNNVNKLKNF